VAPVTAYWGRLHGNYTVTRLGVTNLYESCQAQYSSTRLRPQSALGHAALSRATGTCSPVFKIKRVPLPQTAKVTASVSTCKPSLYVRGPGITAQSHAQSPA